MSKLNFFVTLKFRHTTGPNVGSDAYAGNIDSKMYGFITETDDDRHGASEGISIRNEKIPELAGIGLEHEMMESEYGYIPYTLDSRNYNHLRMKLAGFDNTVLEVLNKCLGIDVSGHELYEYVIFKEETITTDIVCKGI